MVSSRVVDGWPFILSIVYDKRQNGECNVRKFRRFLFGMSPDVPAFKVRVLQVTLNFELA